MRGKKARLLRKQLLSPGRGRELIPLNRGPHSTEVLVCRSMTRRRYQRLKKITRHIPIGLMRAAGPR